MRWTAKQKAIANEAASRAAALDATHLYSAADLARANMLARQHEAAKIIGARYYCYGWRSRKHYLHAAPPYAIARQLDVPLALAREIVRQAEVRSARRAAKHTYTLPRLCERLERFKARREAGRVAARTRKFRALPDAVRAACRTYREVECAACGGHGLRYSPKHERDIRCYACSGEGCSYARQLSPECVLWALDASARGLGEHEILAELDGRTIRTRPYWDGTLTSTWERTGEVSAEQARQIREKVARRHEATEYDALLAGGVDRDTARAMVWEAK